MCDYVYQGGERSVVTNDLLGRHGIDVEIAIGAERQAQATGQSAGLITGRAWIVEYEVVEKRAASAVKTEHLANVAEPDIEMSVRADVDSVRVGEAVSFREDAYEFACVGGIAEYIVAESR